MYRSIMSIFIKQYGGNKAWLAAGQNDVGKISEFKFFCLMHINSASR